MWALAWLNLRIALRFALYQLGRGGILRGILRPGLRERLVQVREAVPAISCNQPELPTEEPTASLVLVGEDALEPILETLSLVARHSDKNP